LRFPLVFLKFVGGGNTHSAFFLVEAPAMVGTDEYEGPPREIRQRNSSWLRLALIFVFVGVAILAMIPLWRKIADTSSSSSVAAAQESPIDQSGGEFTIVGSDSSKAGGDSPSEKGGEKSSKGDDDEKAGKEKSKESAKGEYSTSLPSPPPPSQQPVPISTPGEDYLSDPPSDLPSEVPALGPPTNKPPVSTPGEDYPFVIAIPVGVCIELVFIVYCTTP
jgi:hypothetical protein